MNEPLKGAISTEYDHFLITDTSILNPCLNRIYVKSYQLKERMFLLNFQNIVKTIYM